MNKPVKQQSKIKSIEFNMLRGGYYYNEINHQVIECSRIRNILGYFPKSFKIEATKETQ